MHDNRTDADLIDAFVQLGDESVFRTLYRRHGPRVARLVLRLTGGDTHLAEDLLQEIWINACRGLAGFRREAAFPTWLTAIALNAVRQHYRRHDDEQIVPLQDALLPPAPDHDPSLRVDMERAVAQLPAGFRLVLVLHDVEGFRHREIASALGLSEGTSKSQLTRARRRLRELLNPPREDHHAVE